MAKRFTDTDKWKKPFIRGLEATYKLFWFYILDDCNHAGIWEVDMEVASIRIGEKLDAKKALNFFGDRVKKITESKWFLPDFIFFQYGELSPKNRLHLSVIQILEKNNIKGLLSPLEGVKDKDKDKDKDKVNGFLLKDFDKNFQLDEMDIGKTIEFIKIKTKIELTGAEISDHWTAFKIDNFDKTEWYADTAKLISHFRNSLKNQIIKNGTDKPNNSGSSKLGTSAARIEALRNW